VKITSLQNQIVKHLVTLRKEKSYRHEHKSVLISGKKVIEELKNLPFTTLIVEEGYSYSYKADQVFFVTKEILQKITGLASPEPIAAEIALPKEGSLDGKKRLLALDGVSDPGNMGTLLRSALALGWDGVFITDNSVDPFNDKSMRAAKGAAFHLPILHGSWEDLCALIEKNKLQAYVADKNGKDVKTLKISSPLILILGNESHGVTKNGFPSISIPMHPSMESLNVASAGAILLHELS